MVKQLLLSLLLAASCFGQAFTMSDQPFLAALQGGAPTVQGCGSYTNGLSRYWKIDEGSGIFVTNYVGVPSIGATLLNGAYWDNDGPPVPSWLRNTWSIKCPSYNSYMNCGDSSDYYIIPGDYSISIWSTHPNSYTRTPEIMVHGRNTQFGLFHFGIGIVRIGSNYYYACGDTSTAVGLNVTGPNVLTVGTGWTFWVMTRNGPIWTMWKNDASSGPVGSYTNYNQAVQTQPCTVTAGGTSAGDGYSPQNWSGNVSDFRIYKNYALSSNEVWCLYHQYYQQP